MIIAGSFTVTAGLHFGRTHTFVTHAETGKQWTSKSPAGTDRDLEVTADFIETRTIFFDPTSRIRSCDTRFWTPVREPAPLTRSEFDSLVFIGD